MPAQLQAAREGQTLVLTLSNPELRNAIDPAMYAAGIEALNVAESSAEVRSVVITGAAGVFCSGGNLLRLQASRQADPQVQARGLKVTMPHPVAGQVPLVASPMKLSATPVDYRLPPPMLGEHTDEILAATLGLDAAAIARLRADGVV